MFLVFSCFSNLSSIPVPATLCMEMVCINEVYEASSLEYVYSMPSVSIVEKWEPFIFKLPTYAYTITLSSPILSMFIIFFDAWTFTISHSKNVRMLRHAILNLLVIEIVTAKLCCWSCFADSSQFMVILWRFLTYFSSWLSHLHN